MKYTPVDIETTGLDFNRNKILGVALKDRYYDRTNGEVFTFPEQASFHNGKFDVKFLNKEAQDNRWIKAYAFDTKLAASVLINRPDSLSLADLAQYYLQIPSWKDETNKIFKKKDWFKDPKNVALVRERGIVDLKVTGDLTERLLKELEREGTKNFFFNYIMPAARMLAEVEYRGMTVDSNAFDQKLADINQKIVEIEKPLTAWAGREINWKSPKQIIPLLKEKGYNPVYYDYKKKARVESSGDPCLSQFLPDKNIEMILEHRGLVKLRGYIEGWKESAFEGRIHCSYNMANVRTGRLSCSEPNLQQVPRNKDIRRLFIPRAGKKFVIADLSQIEVRVVAHYSGDENLLKVFKDKLDFYGDIAVRILGANCHPNEVKTKYPEQRQIAKVIGLSILYGIGPAKLSDFIKIQTKKYISKEDCRLIIEDYFKAYPGLLEFRKYVERKVYAGELLTTHYGRKFKIDPERVFSTGVNTLVQSTASDCLLFAQLEIDDRLVKLGITAPVVALIHDEVIREASPEDAPKVIEITEQVLKNQGFKCPIELEAVIGNSWGDKG